MITKEKDLEKNELISLLNESFTKLQKTEEVDSQLLQDKSSTINWVLTLTTLFLGIAINKYMDISDFCLKDFLFNSAKLLFSISIISLIAFKLVSTKYQSIKKLFLNNIHTHKIELQFDIESKLRPKLKDTVLFIPDFINRFRDACFIPAYDTDRKAAFKSFDKKMKIYSYILLSLYWIILSIFVLNTIITIGFISKIYGG